MSNKELIKLAIAAGFDEERVGLATATVTGETVVSVPRDIGALKKLELACPTLEEVEARFHQWLVKA